MGNGKRIKASEVKRLTGLAWRALEAAAGLAGREATDYLEKAERESLRVETEHRRMGSRFVARARYALNTDWAARYQVVRITYRKIRRPKSWRDVGSYRADFAPCQALRETLGLRLPALPDGFEAIDYAGDIAL